MSHKKVKYAICGLIGGGVLAAILTISLPLRLCFFDFYYKVAYPKELKLLNNYLGIILDGNAAQIQKILYDDFYIIERPIHLNTFQQILNQVDIKKFKIGQIVSSKTNNEKSLFVAMYCTNTPQKYFFIGLKQRNNKWLISSIYASEAFSDFGWAAPRDLKQTMEVQKCP